MPKPRHHVLDIYGVHVHLATSKKQWKRLRRELTFLNEKPEALGLSAFATFHPDAAAPPVPHLVFWLDLPALTNPGDLIDTCAHEAAHGANQILDHVGHDTRGTDEPSAYLVGWLTRWLWEACA